MSEAFADKKVSHGTYKIEYGPCIPGGAGRRDGSTTVQQYSVVRTLTLKFLVSKFSRVYTPHLVLMV